MALIIACMKKILDVIPADMPGMDYAARSEINGYQVFIFILSSRISLKSLAALTDLFHTSRQI